MARSFGVTSTMTEATIPAVLNTFREGSTVEIAEARDEDGKVTDQQAYSREETAEFTGLVDGSVTGKAGASVTAGSLTGILNEISQEESNTGYRTISGRLSKKDSATQVAYS